MYTKEQLRLIEETEKRLRISDDMIFNSFMEFVTREGIDLMKLPMEYIAKLYSAYRGSVQGKGVQELMKTRQQIIEETEKKMTVVPRQYITKFVADCGGKGLLDPKMPEEKLIELWNAFAEDQGRTAYKIPVGGED
jgi:hypothetical protein